MLFLWRAFFLTSSTLCLVLALNCDSQTEYLWQGRCCKKCQPGENMVGRCDNSCQTKCAPCSSTHYNDKHNTKWECESCTDCSMEYLVELKACTATQNAVCGCKHGYRCKAYPCQSCEKDDSVTNLSQNDSATTLPLPPTTKHNDVSPDSVTLLTCVVCLCVFLLLTCFVLASRHTRACGRIMYSAIGLWSPRKTSGANQCQEEENMPMPVQEVSRET